jgi:cytochrome c nitrite reductase small subunit
MRSRGLGWLWSARRRVAAAFPLWVWVTMSAVLGSVLGIGLYTLSYAQGLSYLGNDPSACVNCHIMRDVYDGWNHSSHRSVATCNDCHVPHSFPAKYIAKGLNGWHHSVAFTTDNFAEPIRIKRGNKEILQQNCLYCHGELVDPLIQHGDGNSFDCTRCHGRVGHGW